MPPSTPRRAPARAAGLLLTLAAAAGLSAGPLLPAHADEVASTMDVAGQVDAGGTLSVSETLTFPGGAPKQLVQRLATTEDVLNYSHYVFSISDITAKAGSTDLAPQVSTDGDYTVITIDGSKAGASPITISYRVGGAARAVATSQGQNARTEVKWRVLQGLSVPVKTVQGTITTPGTISFINCESGPPVSLSPCSTFGGGTHDNPQPTFSDGPRGAGEVVSLDFGVPASMVASNSVVDHKWTLDRAFAVNRNTLLASLLPLLLGGALLYLLHRRTGRDHGTTGQLTPVAEFTPVGPGESRFTVLSDVRPGHVGTVADERVDPVDITATLLDLAARGWLRIVELPSERTHQAIDWTFERLEGGVDELRPFEARLRDAVAPAASAGVTVSHIGPAVAGVIEEVQRELYEDVVRRGWFERRPDATRNRWTTIGWVLLGVAAVATVLLVAFTSYALVGIALLILGLGALLVGQEMPRRTASGSALLGGLHALAAQLQTQPTNQLPRGHEYQELSRILPYAIVLGGRERWVDALVQADHDEAPDSTDLDWYHAPDDWHLRDLPASLDAFVVAVQGRLFGR